VERALDKRGGNARTQAESRVREDSTVGGATSPMEFLA
jgi:hypothetical protein